MGDIIKLNPMQQSYLHGKEAKYGLFSKACYVYDYDPAAVDFDRLKNALRRLFSVHPILGAALYGESLILNAGHPIIKEEVFESDSIEDKAETLFESFDSDDDCMVEVTLLIGTACSYIVFCVNGIAADGLSHEKIIETLENLYLGKEIQPVECADDFLRYRENLREKKEYEEQCVMLDAETASFPEPAVLALADGMTADETFETAMRKAAISSDVWEAFKQKTASHGATAFSVLLVLAAKAIGMYTENPQLVMNVPRTARMVPVDGIFDAVGMYSDFSLVPVDTTETDSFILAKKLSMVMMEQQFRGAVSGLDILKSWKKNNFEAAAPFVFTSLADTNFESKLFTRRFVRTQTSQVWLEMLLLKNGNDLILEASYQPEIIPDFMAENILAVILKEMERLVSPPEAKNAMTFLALPSMDTLLKDSFLKGGERPYLIWDNNLLSYTETDRLTAKLCRILSMKMPDFHEGLGVGLFLKKGPLQAIAAISASRLGLAFLPLDLDYPDQTIIGISERAGLSLVITEASFAEKIEKTGIPYFIIPEDFLSDKASSDLSYPWHQWNPEEIFVIINTSGTTGEPKSAAIKADGVVNCLVESVRRFTLENTDRCIDITNFCHDMALFDIYGMLACGGAVIYPDAKYEKDPSHWANLMAAYHVTFWNSVPAFMEMLTADPESFKKAAVNLKTVVMGGDFIPVNLVRHLKAENPALKVHSVGGPTETTIWNISHEITKDDLENENIPYGKAFPNTTYYLLNSAGQEVPNRVIGEMCVLGVGVSLGYLGLPSVTEKVFTNWNGHRIYHTGDYGYRLENGDLIIVGRRDGQVKINGKRIELSGIEKVLSKYPGVNQVIAVKSSDSKKLTAFYTADAEVDLSLWKAFMQKRLPDYMTPARFIRLERVPLTRNGKVDRKTLSEYKANEENEKRKQINSSNETVVEKLIQMCQKLFPEEEIDESTNYYVIGGDSIQAIRLLSMIKQEFGVSLGVYDLLEAPFLQSWAEIIEEKLKDAKEKSDTLMSLIQSTIGYKGNVLILDKGIEKKLKTLSIRLKEYGIEKNPYELLAEPYLDRICKL